MKNIRLLTKDNCDSTKSFLLEILLACDAGKEKLPNLFQEASNEAKFIFILNIHTYSFTISFTQNQFKLLTSVHGEKKGDAYSRVAAIGDANGDGYDDFFVGSETDGYAKLYFGGSPFDTLNCIRFRISEHFTTYQAFAVVFFP